MNESKIRKGGINSPPTPGVFPPAPPPQLPALSEGQEPEKIRVQNSS